ncbi:MAG: DUF2158 domain-containing protein [Phycisphaerales bacterium]|nr:DUF2158 domain-containing protein [Phycisphaerales bacterium]
MSQNVREGSTVRLASGGPLMSVLKIHKDEARCVWLDTEDHRQQGDFHIGSLILAEQNR